MFTHKQMYYEQKGHQLWCEDNNEVLLYIYQVSELSHSGFAAELHLNAVMCIAEKKSAD